MTEWIQCAENVFGGHDVLRLYRSVFTSALFEEGGYFVVIALVVWGGLHFALKRWLARRLIGAWPHRRDILREMKYSLSTILVFASINTVIWAMVVYRTAHIYHKPMTHGLPWLLLSLPVLLLWQDFYFYWTHRLLHTRWLLKHVHGVHHRSRHPSPWAAYAFHPAEALNNSVMLLIFLAVVPVNDVVLIVFTFHQIIRNTHGHAAVETMPRGFTRHAFWGQFTTTTHHHLHHETARGNYGLWFTWWDRWCGTERPEYRERFDATSVAREADLARSNNQSAEAVR